MSEEKSNGKILIQFDGIGSAHFSLAADGAISPMQLFSVAEYLKFKATNMLAEQEYLEAQKRAQQQIMVPKPAGIVSDPRKQ